MRKAAAIRFLLQLVVAALFPAASIAAEGPAWLAKDARTVFLATFNGEKAEADFTLAPAGSGTGAWRLAPGLHGKALALQGDETTAFGFAATNGLAQGTIEVITRDLSEVGKYSYNNVLNRRYHRRPLCAIKAGETEIFAMNDQGGNYFLRVAFPRRDHLAGYPLVQASITASTDKLPNEWVCLAVGWDARRGLVAASLRDAASGEALRLSPENSRVLRYPRESMSLLAPGLPFDALRVGPAPELLVDAIRVSDVFREDLFETPKGQLYEELPEAPPTVPEERKK